MSFHSFCEARRGRSAARQRQEASGAVASGSNVLSDRRAAWRRWSADALYQGARMLGPGGGPPKGGLTEERSARGSGAELRTPLLFFSQMKVMK